MYLYVNGKKRTAIRRLIAVIILSVFFYIVKFVFGLDVGVALFKQPSPHFGIVECRLPGVVSRIFKDGKPCFFAAPRLNIVDEFLSIT